MTGFDETVDCEAHGKQQETFVCQHISNSLTTGAPFGFWWSSVQRDEPRPDAWCTPCNEVIAASGGEWTEEATAFARVKLICGSCYDRAKEMVFSSSIH